MKFYQILSYVLEHTSKGSVKPLSKDFLEMK